MQQPTIYPTTTRQAIADLERSLRFYRDLSGQEIVFGLGENFLLSGGSDRSGYPVNGLARIPPPAH